MKSRPAFGCGALVGSATMLGLTVEGLSRTQSTGAPFLALIALGRLAHDLGDQLESIDINPLVALPAGEGAIALDALVVLRG